MILRMQDANGIAEVLPPYDNVMTTGPMGDCVSVIVIGSLINGSYNVVRGYHGLGGVQNVNFASLFNGLQGLDDLKVLVFYGSLQRSPFAVGVIQQCVNNAMQVNNIVAPVVYYDYSNASVYRNGNIQCLSH